MAKTDVLSKANLVKSAKELNKFGFEPPISLESEDDMREGILDVIPDLTDEDEVSATCQKVIDALKKEASKSKAPAKSKEKAPAKGKAKAPTKSKEKVSTKGKAKVLTKGKEKASVKKKSSVLSCYGHKPSSQGAAIDNIVSDGKPHKLESIAKKLIVENSRVLGHLKHLEKDKGLKVAEKNGSYTVTGTVKG